MTKRDGKDYELAWTRKIEEVTRTASSSCNFLLEQGLLPTWPPKCAACGKGTRWHWNSLNQSAEKRASNDVCYWEWVSRSPCYKTMHARHGMHPLFANRGKFLKSVCWIDSTSIYSSDDSLSQKSVKNAKAWSQNGGRHDGRIPESRVPRVYAGMERLGKHRSKVVYWV